MSTGSDHPDRPVTRAPRSADSAATGPESSDAQPDPAAPRGSGPDADAPGTSDTTAPGHRHAGDGRTEGQHQGERPGTDEVDTPSGGKTAVLWIALVLGAIVLVLLLIFVIQNNVTTQFQYFNAQFDLPLGVAMLLAAIAGALVMALVGSVRMIQMRWTIRKLRKTQEKIQRAAR